MRCKLCFKWQQLSKPRARPLDVEGQPRRNATSRSETKGRCRSTSKPPPRVKKTTRMQDRLVINQRRHDARHDINKYRRRRHGDAEERGYSAHRGKRYDSNEYWMTPKPLGARVFSRAIRSTPLPSPFRPPTSIAKYNGETKPEL